MRPKDSYSHVLEEMDIEQLTDLLDSVKQEINCKRFALAAYHEEQIKRAIRDAQNAGMIVHCNLDDEDVNVDLIGVCYETEE